MKETHSVPRFGRSVRFCLSLSGVVLEAAYRSRVTAAKGRRRGLAFERARSEWASSHGLEPDDGAYLVELSTRSLTLKQIGEALAVCSQSREMVLRTIGRLVFRGFVRVVTGGAQA